MQRYTPRRGSKSKLQSPELDLRNTEVASRRPLTRSVQSKSHFSNCAKMPRATALHIVTYSYTFSTDLNRYCFHKHIHCGNHTAMKCRRSGAWNSIFPMPGFSRFLLGHHVARPPSAVTPRICLGAHGCDPPRAGMRRPGGHPRQKCKKKLRIWGGPDGTPFRLGATATGGDNILLLRGCAGWLTHCTFETSEFPAVRQARATPRKSGRFPN